jgi:hypothetical protein
MVLEVNELKKESSGKIGPRRGKKRLNRYL